MEFQSYAHGKNHWLLDPDLKPVLQQYWKDLHENEDKLVQFGETAGGPAYELADYIDRSAQPELVMLELMQKKGAHENYLDEFIPILEKAGTTNARLAAEVLEKSFSQLLKRSPAEAQYILFLETI